LYKGSGYIQPVVFFKVIYSMPRPEKAFCDILKRLLIVIVAIFFIVPIFAQSYTRNDSVQIYEWLSQADEQAVTGSLDSAMKYANLALQLGKEKKMLRGEGFGKLKVADILFQKESSVSINEFYGEGMRIGTQLKDSFMMALSCYQQGEYIMYEDQLEEAEKLYNKALLLKFGKEQSNYTALVYNDMGYLYGLKDELEKQTAWYLKAITIYEKTGDSKGLASTTSSLAAVYAKLGNTSKAFEYTRDAIAMREKIRDVQGLANSYENLSRLFWTVSLDSASKYQQIAMSYAEKSGAKSLMIRSYDNLSILMDRQRNKPEALAWIKKSIALCRDSNDKAGLAGKCRWAALLCADMKDTIAMEAFYQESYDLSVQLKNKTLLRDFYGTRAGYYSGINDFKNAYDNLKKYYSYRDSIVSDETAISITELQTKYETEKKDNEITRLNTDQKIKQLEIEKQKAIISGNILQAKQKENEIKLLSQQQELRDIRIKQQGEELEKQLLIGENNQKKLQLAATEKILKDKELRDQKQLRNLIIGTMVLLVILGFVLFNRYQLKKKLQQQKALLTVRNNIAKDLHDEIGSALTSIKILSQVSHNNLQKDQGKASSMLEKITEQSSQMQQGMSDIVWAITPDNDKLRNMVVRMREYITHTLEPKNIRTHFEVDEAMLSKNIGMEQRRDFFLIFKEAINNTAKYSGAGHVDILLSGNNKKIHLAIIDDGIGFDTSLITSSNGLRNMRARTEALKGRFYIHSSQGKGVKLEIEIPAT
jgi:two-component system sensor histidine kinase UhpB